MGIGPTTFNITVASAGTRVQLTAASTYAQAVFFEAHEANAGSIYIGGSAVSTTSYVKALTARQGFSVNARDNAMPGPDGGMVDLKKWYVDAGTAAQVVCVSYILHVGA